MAHRFLAPVTAILLGVLAPPAGADMPAPIAIHPTATPTPQPTAPCAAPPLVLRAAAAPNQVRSGESVTLQGSVGGAAATVYSWWQVSGPAVALVHSDTAAASFTAPAVASPTSLVFGLMAYLGGTPASYQATVEVTVLPPTGVAWVGVTDAHTIPGQPASVGVRLYTDLNVTRLEHDLELVGPLAILTTPDGRPDCTLAPELDAATAQFELRPQGCTGTDCTGVHVSLVASGALANGAQLYGCRMMPGVAVEPSCEFRIACADPAAYDTDGAALPAQCSGGVVHSEYPDPQVRVTLSVDPPQPQLGDIVHVGVLTNVTSGLVGIPTYQLHGAEPWLVGETTRRFSNPQSFAFELQAVEAGNTQLSVSVDFETEHGCPGFAFYDFRYAASAPVSLEVGMPNVTPSATPTPLTPVVTEISGVVYDAALGVGVPIADAEIDYEYRGSGASPDPSGTVHSDAQGRYMIVLPLAGGVVDLTAAAAGFATLTSHADTRRLASGEPANLGLARVGGIVQVEPAYATVCSGDLGVTVTNTGPPGEPLVILRIEGSGGAGFLWDFSAFQMPIALGCGEQLRLPVAFDAAGLQFPSQFFDLQVISGARAGSGRATYYGNLNCDPTPTPTMTAAPVGTGDLGTKQVHGRIYNAAHGVDTGIAGAAVTYLATHGSGTVDTDDHGDFSFSLFLHDTDFITVRASAAGFRPSEVHFGGYELWTLPMLDLGLALADPTHHRIAGHVRRDPYCPATDTVTVTLTALGSGEPLQSLIVPSDEFAFDDVADGDYSVSAWSECQPSYAPPVSAHVRGADIEVDVAFEQWCPPVLALSPARGAPGTSVEVRGRCYYIHSGGQAEILFDAQPIATFHGNTSGDYTVQIDIPADASAGRHQIVVRSSSSHAPIGAADFLVDTDGSAPCAGDCNGDGRVAINELVIGVRLALGFADVPCASIHTSGGGEVTVAELVAAVANALNGCQ